MSNATYRFGLLLMIFGGFLASNSSGQFAGVGIGALFAGLAIGVVGLLQSGLPRSD